MKCTMRRPRAILHIEFISPLTIQLIFPIPELYACRKQTNTDLLLSRDETSAISFWNDAPLASRRVTYAASGPP